MRPRLIHPVDVTIAPIDSAATPFDHAAREPIPTIRRSAVVPIKAQVHWGRKRERQAMPGGPVDQSDGYLVFLTKDLATLTYTPREGDRVATISGRACELYLTSDGQDRGQYGGQPHLCRAYFRDRQPRHD